MPLLLLNFHYRFFKLRRHICPDGKLDDPEPLILPFGTIYQQLFLIGRRITLKVDSVPLSVLHPVSPGAPSDSDRPLVHSHPGTPNGLLNPVPPSELRAAERTSC